MSRRRNLKDFLLQPSNLDNIDTSIGEDLSPGVFCHERLRLEGSNEDCSDAPSQTEYPLNTGKISTQTFRAGLKSCVENQSRWQYLRKMLLRNATLLCKLHEAALLRVCVAWQFKGVASCEDLV